MIKVKKKIKANFCFLFSEGFGLIAVYYSLHFQCVIYGVIDVWNKWKTGGMNKDVSVCLCVMKMFVCWGVTWRALHVNHKVVVGWASLPPAGVREGRAAVELRALGAASLVRGQHGEAGSVCSIGFIQALGYREAALQPGAAGLSCDVKVHVVQFGQTPALQLTDQGRLLKGTYNHTQ